MVDGETHHAVEDRPDDGEGPGWWVERGFLERVVGLFGAAFAWFVSVFVSIQRGEVMGVGEAHGWYGTRLENLSRWASRWRLEGGRTSPEGVRRTRAWLVISSDSA